MKIKLKWSWKKGIAYVIRAVERRRQELAPQYNTEYLAIFKHPKMVEEYDYLTWMLDILGTLLLDRNMAERFDVKDESG